MADRYFGSHENPMKPHLLRGSGGVAGEVADLRGDVAAGFQRVDDEVGDIGDWALTPVTELYVSLNGDDANPGTIVRPVATIAKAIEKAIAIETADPTVGVTIVVADGTYAEDIVLEDANLVWLTIKSLSGKRGVTVNALQSTANNDGFNTLYFQGISFLSTVTLTGPDGSTFGDYIEFRDCLLDAGTVVKTTNRVYIYDGSYVNVSVELVNCGTFKFNNSSCYGAITCDFDDTQPINAGTYGNTSQLTFLNESQLNANVTISRTGGSSCALNLVGDSRLNGSRTITIGDNCGFILGTGTFHFGYTVLGANTTVFVYDSVFVRWGQLTADATAQIKYWGDGTLGSVEVDTGTATVDEIAEVLASGCEWLVTATKGANTKTSRVQAAWEKTGHTVADNVTETTVGVVDVTYAVDISGGKVRLRATATSDDWKVTARRLIVINNNA